MITIEPTITRATAVTTTATSIVSAAEAGAWLELSPSMITARTALLTSLIESAITPIEGYTWLSVLRRTYVADYDLGCGGFAAFCAGDRRLLLNRAPIMDLGDIAEIAYLDDNNVYVAFDRGAETADGLYANTTERYEPGQWASLYFREPVPYQARTNAYKVRVTYAAGYAQAADVPAGIKTAIKMIVASDFADRGDCGCDINGYPVPCAAKRHLDPLAISRAIL